MLDFTSNLVIDRFKCHSSYDECFVIISDYFEFLLF